MSKEATEQNGRIINYDVVSKMNEKEEVLVNTNRIYWQLSEELREQKRKAVIRELLAVIERISEDKRMYIPMDAKTVTVCFSSRKDELPNNTFRCSTKESQSTNVV